MKLLVILLCLLGTSAYCQELYRASDTKTKRLDNVSKTKNGYVSLHTIIHAGFPYSMLDFWNDNLDKVESYQYKGDWSISVHNADSVFILNINSSSIAPITSLKLFDSKGELKKDLQLQLNLNYNNPKKPPSVLLHDGNLILAYTLSNKDLWIEIDSNGAEINRYVFSSIKMNEARKYSLENLGKQSAKFFTRGRISPKINKYEVSSKEEAVFESGDAVYHKDGVFITEDGTVFDLNSETFFFDNYLGIAIRSGNLKSKTDSVYTLTWIENEYKTASLCKGTYNFHSQELKIEQVTQLKGNYEYLAAEELSNGNTLHFTGRNGTKQVIIAGIKTTYDEFNVILQSKSGEILYETTYSLETHMLKNLETCDKLSDGSIQVIIKEVNYENSNAFSYAVFKFSATGYLINPTDHFKIRKL